MYAICFSNQKGGVGKTTTSVNLAYSFARRISGRVLLLDQDIQGNASARFLHSQQLPLERTVAALYQNNLLQDPDQIIHPTRIDGLDLVPSNRSFIHDYT